MHFVISFAILFVLTMIWPRQMIIVAMVLGIGILIFLGSINGQVSP